MRRPADHDSFTGSISVESILAGYRDVDYRSDNDVIYLIDITLGSPDEGELIPLDIGEGNYPVTLERSDYWNNDIREWTLSSLMKKMKIKTVTGDSTRRRPEWQRRPRPGEDVMITNRSTRRHGC